MGRMKRKDYIHVEKVVGVGDESLYVYHFPSERMQFSNSYPIKIGRAKGDPVYRIMAQQASMAEKPVIDLVIKCDDSKYLEAYVHEKLKHLSVNKFGSEWFNCDPDTVESLCESESEQESVMTIGQLIRLHRKRAGLTQCELAEKAGIWQRTISNIERSDGSTHIRTIEAICDAMGLKISVVPK